MRIKKNISFIIDVNESKTKERMKKNNHSNLNEENVLMSFDRLTTIIFIEMKES